MTIKNVYEIVTYIMNKHQGGYLNAAEFNLNFRKAELDHMDYLIGEFRRTQYQGRVPVGPQLGINKKLNESLSPFRKPISLNTGDSGEVGKPNNMAIVEAMNMPDGTPIVPQQPERLGVRMKSVVNPPSKQPIYAEYDTYWKVYPIDMGAFVATVIEYPPFSKYAVTVVSSREVYDSANSVDPIWRNGDLMEIIGRMLKTIGVNLKDGELLQYAQSIINQGE